MAIVDKHIDIGQLQKNLVEANWRAKLYQSHYQRSATSRDRMQREYEVEIFRLKQKHRKEIEHLQIEITELKAKVKLRERQLFGTKSEKKFKSQAFNQGNGEGGRGQKPGQSSPSKRDHSHLPEKEEERDLLEDEKICPSCKKPYSDMGATEDSKIVEIAVEAHIRRIKRKKYKRSCQCKGHPIILTAPKEPKVILKSHLGNSIWIHCLMQKYWHGQPINRVLEELKSKGVDLSSGTLCNGFGQIAKCFRPIYEKIIEKNLKDKHWHADETGWKVFETIDGKANHRWFLWVLKSENTSVFVLDPSRGAKVIEKYFGKNTKGILSCDRYRAYSCFVSKSNSRFSIAYCWAHVRRDFLSIAKDWPKYETFATEWIKEIGHLYHLNTKRRLNPKDKGKQKQLEEAIKNFKKKADAQQRNENLAKCCRKVLKSLDKHWSGLTLFVKNPKIPMDNNAAERELRQGAVGRKNYYGSGSIKSGELAETMFTIIKTLLIWKINPREWLEKLVSKEKWEEEIDQWLPWNMTAHQKKEFRLGNHHDPPN